MDGRSQYELERENARLRDENARLISKLAKQASRDGRIKQYGIYAVVGILTFFILSGAMAVTYGEISRWQRVRNANNQIAVMEKQAEVTRAQTARTEAEADIRRIEAEGIRDAQIIIDQSLTDTYLTFEAIQAQKALAQSDNATFIYIPTGDMGVPQVGVLPSPANPFGE